MNRDYTTHRPSIRIRHDRREVEAFVSLDGAVWVWTERGQQVLANSAEARGFLLKHAADEDRERAVRMTRSPDAGPVSPLSAIAIGKWRGNDQ